MVDFQTPTWRDKQKIGGLMSRLQRHGYGEVEMTSTQIAAAKLYLSKTLPDLTSMQLSGDPDGSPIVVATRASDEQLENLKQWMLMKGDVGAKVIEGESVEVKEGE